MTRINWDEQTFESGIDRGAIFADDQSSAWNGLISIDQDAEGFGSTPTYVDGHRVNQTRAFSRFSATLTAYTYPDLFLEFTIVPKRVFSQKRKRSFGFTYRSRVSGGYLIHLVYNVFASPSNDAYTTSSESDSTISFAWSLSTVTIPVENVEPTSHLIVDTRTSRPEFVLDLENILYGTSGGEPRMPPPEEVISIFEENAVLRVVDNGDGTFTVTGPDDAIDMINATTFAITWPTAIFVDDDTYTISSY